MRNVKGIAATWLSLTELTNLNSGEGGSNLVDVKKFKYMNQTYPYVSGQAMRAYLKESMRRSLSSSEYMCMPNAKGETCGDIQKCIQCDIFGYMIPKKKKVNKKNDNSNKDFGGDSVEEEIAGGADTRISPVKVAPAIGQFPFFDNSTLDFLTRRKPQEKADERRGDIVNVELGKNLYKCGLDIDIQRVGNNEEIDLNKRELKFSKVIETEESLSRIRKTLEALKYLSDYSKQARLLTDFTPDIICVSFQKRYSHRLQKLFETQPPEATGVHLNTQRLVDTLSDILQYSESVFFGMMSGIVSPESERLIAETLSKLDIALQRPDQAIQSAISMIRL